ncbi:hypothetical protein FA95DRAFT_95060 [Auriscalpium vulgare]|uniref:Uncharacterized protein n=1 Tax=Auriscalpium vulgare TaxID=40419 RepID=A0ACB8RPR4_9AGAM|nr:hypothetical protein FA95DRAFT_95060 [Auriscalpium vulgare]
MDVWVRPVAAVLQGPFVSHSEFRIQNPNPSSARAKAKTHDGRMLRPHAHRDMSRPASLRILLPHAGARTPASSASAGPLQRGCNAPVQLERTENGHGRGMGMGMGKGKGSWHAHTHISCAVRGKSNARMEDDSPVQQEGRRRKKEEVGMGTGRGPRRGLARSHQLRGVARCGACCNCICNAGVLGNANANGPEILIAGGSIFYRENVRSSPGARTRTLTRTRTRTRTQRNGDGAPAPARQTPRRCALITRRRPWVTVYVSVHFVRAAAGQPMPAARADACGVAYIHTLGSGCRVCGLLDKTAASASRLGWAGCLPGVSVSGHVYVSPLATPHQKGVHSAPFVVQGPGARPPASHSLPRSGHQNVCLCLQDVDRQR